MLDLYIHLLFNKHKYVHFLQLDILKYPTMNSQPSDGQLNTALLLLKKIINFLQHSFSSSSQFIWEPIVAIVEIRIFHKWAQDSKMPVL